jgi:hypothetical protein
MTKRAYTLVEVVIASGLMALIVAALTALFGFAAKRSAHSVARFTVLHAGKVGTTDLARTIEEAVSCSRVANGASDALVCTMPLNGSDTDGDGFNDAYAPSRASKRGFLHYGTGQRVWYYLAAASGQFGESGNYLFRAVRNDSLDPTVSDIDPIWSFEPGTSQPKRGPFATMTISSNALSKTVSFSLEARTAIRQTQIPTNGEAAQSLQLSGIAHWRHNP